LTELLKENTKAIIAVDLYGVPYKIEEVRTIADRY
jgi:dTDP-4-amino-4,6-dideoxygalactose transaminase